MKRCDAGYQGVIHIPLCRADGGIVKHTSVTGIRSAFVNKTLGPVRRYPQAEGVDASVADVIDEREEWAIHAIGRVM